LKRVIEIHLEQYLTKLLFYLEKESVFRSFFTLEEDEEVSEIIQEIWIKGFDRLKFEEIQLQNLPQSNYTTFFSNLSFPFSREEARILSEIIID
jgi:hypothetical protein